jgi:hypothetical protein
MMMRQRWKYLKDVRPSGPGDVNVECPVKCGRCCCDEEFVTCEKVTEDGCSLPREERPFYCNEHLCPPAREVLRLNAAASEVPDQCCLAEGHDHGSRVEEALCSLAFQRDALQKKVEDLEEWRRQMVEKAAAKSLDGYRELGAKCAALEKERDDLFSTVSWFEDTLEGIAIRGVMRHTDHPECPCGACSAKRHWANYVRTREGK